MFVVFAGHFCPDLVYCGGYGMGVWDLGIAIFTADNGFFGYDAIFLGFRLRIGPIEVIALIVFIGYAWRPEIGKSADAGCRYKVVIGSPY